MSPGVYQDGVYVVVGSDGPDTLTGTDGPDRIFGMGGGDHLYGLAGDDVLIGGAGADTMDGGTGDDSFDVDNSGDVVIEAQDGGHAFVSAQVNWVATAGSRIESLSASGAGQEQLTGNLHSDSYSLEIMGNGTVNRLSDGGGRADLYGGYGNDVYVVTNALTVVHEFDGSQDFSPGHGPDAPTTPPPPDPLAEGYDTIDTNLAAYTLPANVEKLVYFGTGNFIGTGNAENNDISGGAGNDTLDGGAGGDRITGGAGNDTYYVDDVRDAVIELPGGGTDVVHVTASSYVVPLNVEYMIYTGTGNFRGYANAGGGATIVGGAGNDFLSGGAGADTLWGNFGAGHDTLLGGSGVDTFAINGVAGNFETASDDGLIRIIDFQPGVDKISVQQPNTFTMDYLLYNGPPSSAPRDMLDPDEHTEYFSYDQSHGQLFRHYAPNATSAYDMTLVATFDNHPTLTSSDFEYGALNYTVPFS